MLCLPRISFVTKHHKLPNRDSTEPKMGWGKVNTYPWLWVGRQAAEAEELEGGASVEKIPILLSFAIWCVLVCPRAGHQLRGSSYE